MPIRTEQIADQDLTVFVVTGEFSLRELWQTVTSYFEGAPTTKNLWDLRAAEGRRGTREHIQDILSFAKRHASKRPSGMTAFVTSSELDFGLARTTEALSEGLGLPWEVWSFRSMDEAVAWLGVDYPTN